METHWRHWHQHFPVTASTASAPSHPAQSTGASRLIMLCAMITGTRQCQGHNYWHQATIAGTRPQLLAPEHNPDLKQHQENLHFTLSCFIVLFHAFSCFFMLFRKSK